MNRLIFGVLLFPAMLCFAAAFVQESSASPNEPEVHEMINKAEELTKQGLWKDALELLQPWTLDPKTEANPAGQGLEIVVQSLNALNREVEIDAYLEEMVTTHPNIYVKWYAAAAYAGSNHDGTLVDNKFVRGGRGRGQRFTSEQRDRVRALQLMYESLGDVKKLDNKNDVAEFYMNFATVLISDCFNSQSWKLQVLTDLETLPDYEVQSWYHSDSYAPVDAEGKPVFYDVPVSFEEAKNDGERWRWALEQAMKSDPKEYTGTVLTHRAAFLSQQFGVETLREYQSLFRVMQTDSDSTDKTKADSGTWALHTLNDDETIARLATGVKRFSLPEEQNPITLYNRVLESGTLDEKQQALLNLAAIYENRRQYEKAAQYWDRLLKDFPLAEEGNREYWQNQKNQIVKNWGRFEPTGSQVHGKGAQLQYLFRNGKSVSFTAREIKVPELLASIKKYIRSKPQQIDWRQINVDNLGYDLVVGNVDVNGRTGMDPGSRTPRSDRTKFLGREVAKWVQELQPAAMHFDRRVTITTPLSSAGAYLLEAKMEDGNTDYIIVWLNDSAIVRKQLEGAIYYYVAEAQNGAPLPEAELEFFGFRRQGNSRNNIEFDIKELKKKTDANGQLTLGNNDVPQNYQWMISAKTPEKDGKPGTFAFFGFSNVWYSQPGDREKLDQVKAFFISDRPVYRPKDGVEYKFWLARSKYDLPEKPEFAGKEVVVSVHSPRDEKIDEKLFKLDSFGGLVGKLELPTEATLGTYRFAIRASSGKNPDGSLKEDGQYYGGGSIRVEEYKKPEYEVVIESPKEPVSLGETIPVTIRAKYYFGSPVVDAKVKYTITREKHTTRWFPPGPWDWLYEPGYWWFAYDYSWYPGWRNWGCAQPMKSWMPDYFRFRSGPPEVVAEETLDIGPEGTVQVRFDTAFAKAVFPDDDQKYTVKVEVVDQSRRTIYAENSVLVTKKPFEVYAWVDRGYYNPNQQIQAKFQSRTIQGNPVPGKASVKVHKISYDTTGAFPVPKEVEVHATTLEFGESGEARLSLNAGESGQYRVSCKLTDAAGREQEGAYIFNVYGPNLAGSGSFEFNRLELIPDKMHYAPGEELALRLNANRTGQTVLLFLRPEYGAYSVPKIIRMKEKSELVKIPIALDDMPNFFIEAICVSDGELLCESKEVVVPPEKRMLNVEVIPSSESYKPGEKAKAKIRVTDLAGNPVSGQNVVSVYDKSLEYVSGGSNVEDIKKFFWEWRRQYHPNSFTTLSRYFHHVPAAGQQTLDFLGIFGSSVADDVEMMDAQIAPAAPMGGAMMKSATFARGGMDLNATMEVSEEMAPMAMDTGGVVPEVARELANSDAEGGALVEATVRKEFADTALWIGALSTDADGTADIELDMPENLTSWKINIWSMAGGTRVGYASTEVLTRKDLIIRMQSPRFLIEKDKAVFSANVHNYLKTEKKVRVSLEFDDETIVPAEGTELVREITVAPGEDRRVDWNVLAKNVTQNAVVRMKALTDEESDAVQSTIPVFVHGMTKLEAQSGAMKSNETSAKVEIRVPEERRPEETKLTIRFSPTLAGAMIDALPYLVDYPYGCTEQTLNRFIPTLITQKMLQDMNIDLESLEKARANLNAQELGDPAQRAKQWDEAKRKKRNADGSERSNPVFSTEEVRNMTREGLEKLKQMQLYDGGWGWFSGYGETSSAHITAQIVRGLHNARLCDFAVEDAMFERGVKWLRNYQQQQITMLENGKLPETQRKNLRWKTQPDALDAYVYLTLMETVFAQIPQEQRKNPGPEVTTLLGELKTMKNFLYLDRVKLPLYGVSLLGLALEIEGDKIKSQMCLRMLSQYLVEDDENQTAYLDIATYGHGFGGWRWWCWFDDAFETQAMYLKLLVRSNPKSDVAPKLVKYLLNNRKHATYWNSTRDTALCVEAFAEYLKATGETKPKMTLDILVDGQVKKTQEITSENLFQIDNTVTLTGEELASGAHTIEFRKKGTGPIYFNTYLEYFTLEEHIPAAGLEVKIERRYYKLQRNENASSLTAGASGQVLDLKAEKYERVVLQNLAEVQSGDLIEIELLIESKNDYESLMIEDMKAAGTEPTELRSGYNGNPLGAYVEYRDAKTTFFVYRLPRGKHSVTYRLRAEQPGVFSALPAKVEAMYAPELKGNSEEFKLGVTDGE